MNRLVLSIPIILFNSAASSHDFWSNGEPVPAWAKQWCCGKSDVHRLHAASIHIMPDGYHVDGLNNVLPFSKAMPSPDGQYWAFFKEDEGPEAHVSCFYAPINDY
jgi:hypothetical protein